MRRFTLFLFLVFMLPLHAQRSDFDAISFIQAENIATAHKGQELINLPILVYKLTAHLDTDVERFRAIYYWVCHNIKGDYHLMVQNTNMRKKLATNPRALEKWNKQFKKEVFKKLVHKKQTLCSGYSYLIKEMANLAGLECQIVNGFGPTNNIKVNNLDSPNHSWNAIKLNNKWYLCDATWSSGLINMAILQFEYEFDDSYFLMEPIEFVKSHWPLESKWALLPKSINTNLGAPNQK